MIWGSCGAVTGTNLVTFLIGAIALRFVFLLPSELVPFFVVFVTFVGQNIGLVFMRYLYVIYIRVYVVFVFVFLWCSSPPVFVTFVGRRSGVVLRLWSN